jgi:hypothetical protein
MAPLSPPLRHACMLYPLQEQYVRLPRGWGVFFSTPPRRVKYTFSDRKHRFSSDPNVNGYRNGRSQTNDGGPEGYSATQTVYPRVRRFVNTPLSIYIRNNIQYRWRTDFQRNSGYTRVVRVTRACGADNTGGNKMICF